jgi:hypothetical protein
LLVPAEPIQWALVSQATQNLDTNSTKRRKTKDLGIEEVETEMIWSVTPAPSALSSVQQWDPS